MMALLLVAHGSRRSASNREIQQLTDRLQHSMNAANAPFKHVACAFLELAEPDIQTGLEGCLALGATEISVLPYFLADGIHVAEDIPREVAEVQTRHPTVTIRINPYFGAAAQVPQVLLEIALQAAEGDTVSGGSS